MKIFSPLRNLSVSITILFVIITGSSQAFSTKIIFDTDLGPDSDDAGALAVLHALAANGEAEILAIMCSTKSPCVRPVRMLSIHTILNLIFQLAP